MSYETNIYNMMIHVSEMISANVCMSNERTIMRLYVLLSYILYLPDLESLSAITVVAFLSPPLVTAIRIAQEEKMN